MLGLYEDFPENIHRIDNFTSTLSNQKFQQKLVQTLHDVNRKPFGLEEISHPSLHECTVIFEVGIAEIKSFNFIDDEEAKRVLNAIRKQAFQVLDFFIAVRYYKSTAPKKTPLRFDYYMVRFVFRANNSVELQVFHEKGPRYISPEDIVNFVGKEVNGGSTRKILKKVEPT